MQEIREIIEEFKSGPGKSRDYLAMLDMLKNGLRRDKIYLDVSQKEYFIALAGVAAAKLLTGGVVIIPSTAVDWVNGLAGQPDK